MWGGFGLIQLDIDKAMGIPVVKQSSQYSFSRMFAFSKHFHLKPNTFSARIKSFLFRKLYM
jgi:hypothetical protein